jgi:FtsP/CotA-like multicopper oxidase with cupredoxin domain
MPHELGPKDVVYVGENEKVSVIMKFDDTHARLRDAAENPTDPLAPRTGRYMMHCHNLVHEDHDMMAQFEVGAGGPNPWGPDPDDLTKKSPMSDDATTPLGPDGC